MPRMILLLVEVIAVALLAVVASRHFGLADGLRITVSYLVAYLIPLFLLRRARGSSDAAHAVLLLIAIFMSFLAYNCLLTWTMPDGYSLRLPDLIGDARNYFKWALCEYNGTPNYVEGVMFPGFPMIMMVMWKVFGLSIIWPQAMNMTFTMTSVVLTGMMTRRLLAHRIPVSPATLVFGAISLMCLLMFYITSGVTILKEAPSFLSMTMGGYALSSMMAADDERRHLWRDIVIFAAACLLMAVVRTTFLYFLAWGVVVITIPHWRRDWIVSLCMLVLIAVFMVIGNHFADYSFNRHAEIMGGGWNMQRTFNTEKAYDKSLLGFYFLYSPWHRLLMLPMTMAMQFILPFPVPWVPVTEHNEPYLLLFLTRVTYGWYLFGGTVLFYCLFMSWRRGYNIGIWAWWPVTIFIGLAYVMGGTMSRYVLPFQPLMVPIVLFTLYHIYQGRWRKFFLIWIIAILLIVVGISYYYHEMR